MEAQGHNGVKVGKQGRWFRCGVRRGPRHRDEEMGVLGLARYPDARLAFFEAREAVAEHVGPAVGVFLAAEALVQG